MVFYSRINLSAVCTRVRTWNGSCFQKRYYNMEGELIIGVTLKYVTEKLKEFAPVSLAESWDNVGLLLEPARKRAVSKILLTNDLTEDVIDEALFVSANLIISYHPPIFAPLKRITNATWKERIIAKCLANDIAIYSPHTSWDVVQGGVNDWLTSAFKCSEIKPLMQEQDSSINSLYILTIDCAKSDLFENLKSSLHASPNFKLLFTESILDSSNYKFTIQSDKHILQKLISKLREDPSIKNYYITPEYKVTEARGIGRMCKLESPISIRDAVDTLKNHIGVPFVQLALARNSTTDDLVQTIAFVAGSGGSVLKNVFCDLKITGEASHHEILDWIHNGSTVILTNHSNSERGFLWKFKEILALKLDNPAVQIVVSSKDADPLKVY